MGDKEFELETDSHLEDKKEHSTQTQEHKEGFQGRHHMQ